MALEIPVVRFLPVVDTGANDLPGDGAGDYGSDGEGDDGGGGGGGIMTPVYTTTPFTQGGVVSQLVTNANPAGAVILGNAGYVLTVATMIQDGSLHDFSIYISPVSSPVFGGTPYGVQYLDPLGVLTDGFAVAVP